MHTPFTILTAHSFTMFYKGTLSTCTNDINQWDDIVTAYREERWDDIQSLVDQSRAIAEFTVDAEGVEVHNGYVYFNGKEMHGALIDRILQMRREGFNCAPMTAFLSNLMNNPSYRSREQLYGFLEANTLPITPDGHFMAYKLITDNWKDCRTKTIDNSIGAVVNMQRCNVDDDQSRTCSAGLHVCSKEYLPHYRYGDQRLIAVKVNPAHVVAVPTDYHNSKMRVEQYTVLQELPISMIDGVTDRWDKAVVEDEPITEYIIEHTILDSWLTPEGNWSDDSRKARIFSTQADAEDKCPSDGFVVEREE